MVVPRIDPLRKNFDQFRSKYNVFIVLLMLFFTGVQIAALAVNLGARFNILIAIMPLVGILFFYIGMILPNTKRNYFVGIRTPWTITDTDIWIATHRMGGKLMMVVGAVFVVLGFLSLRASARAPIILAGAVVSGLLPAAYSWWLWHRKKRQARP
jgi:uncharacterized membrane protein